MVSATVIVFVSMAMDALEVDRVRGTAGSTVDNLGSKTGSVVLAEISLKSFDCHCGVELELLFHKNNEACTHYQHRLYIFSLIARPMWTSFKCRNIFACVLKGLQWR